METIANQDVARVLARTHECMRRLLDAGLSFDDLQKPITDPAMRDSLVQYWKNNANPRSIDAKSEAKKLLRFQFSFKTKATKKFTIGGKFVEGKTIDGVSIASLSDGLKAYLLDKIERDVEATVLKVHVLLKAAADLSGQYGPGIISELAGEHETKFAHFFQLLAHKQRMKDFTAVIMYTDTKEVVRAVWNAGLDGWDFGIRSVASLDGWNADNQVVSC